MSLLAIETRQSLSEENFAFHPNENWSFPAALCTAAQPQCHHAHDRISRVSSTPSFIAICHRSEQTVFLKRTSKLHEKGPSLHETVSRAMTHKFQNIYDAKPVLTRKKVLHLKAMDTRVHSRKESVPVVKDLSNFCQTTAADAAALRRPPREGLTPESAPHSLPPIPFCESAELRRQHRPHRCIQSRNLQQFSRVPPLRKCVAARVPPASPRTVGRSFLVVVPAEESASHTRQARALASPEPTTSNTSQAMSHLPCRLQVAYTHHALFRAAGYLAGWLAGHALLGCCRRYNSGVATWLRHGRLCDVSRAAHHRLVIILHRAGQG